MEWARRLAPETPDFTPNPQWIPDGNPDFLIKILQLVPQPVPFGVTQVIQVVERTLIVVNGECASAIIPDFRLDIVHIGDRLEIDDTLSLRGLRDDCLVWELARHIVGFGSKTGQFDIRQNKKISKIEADFWKSQMTRPITTFQTRYSFFRGDCCQNLEGVPFFGLLRVDRGERLVVDGIMPFPPDPPPPPLPPSPPSPPTPPSPTPPAPPPPVPPSPPSGPKPKPQPKPSPAEPASRKGEEAASLRIGNAGRNDRTKPT